MKKISLKDVKNGLKRDEMRIVMGGCGSQCGSGSCSVFSGGATSTGMCVGYQSGNFVTCYCSALGGMNTILSNGGMSRCWK
jgi:hypothetical protein